MWKHFCQYKVFWFLECSEVFTIYWQSWNISAFLNPFGMSHSTPNFWICHTLMILVMKENPNGKTPFNVKTSYVDNFQEAAILECKAVFPFSSNWRMLTCPKACTSNIYETTTVCVKQLLLRFPIISPRKSIFYGCFL